MITKTIVNPLVKWVLRTPFHWVMSGGVMLVSVKGRRSGLLRTTPVQYVRSGAEIFVVSRRERLWWRNVEGGERVTLRLRGEDVAGEADVLRDPTLAANVFEGTSLARPSKRDDAVIVRVRVVE